MLIFQRPHASHTVTTSKIAFRCALILSLIQIEPVNLSGTSNFPLQPAFTAWRFEALLMTALACLCVKTVAVADHGRHAGGLRRPWYLPPWHKCELSSTIDNVTVDLVCSFLLWLIPDLETLSSRLCLCCFGDTWFSRGSYSDEGSFLTR